MNISGVSAATNYAAAVRGDKTSGTEKTAKNGMSGGFIERIKAYAKEDAKKGVYMSEGFTQMRLAHMKQYVSPDRSGPKNQVMSAPGSIERTSPDVAGIGKDAGKTVGRLLRKSKNQFSPAGC